MDFPACRSSRLDRIEIFWTFFSAEIALRQLIEGGGVAVMFAGREASEQ